METWCFVIFIHAFIPFQFFKKVTALYFFLSKSHAIFTDERRGGSKINENFF